MAKVWLSYEQQLALLEKRGLLVEDHQNARKFLQRVSYYRLSGYFRYWQRDPSNGDDHFVKGASFRQIQDLYEAEEQLIVLCDDVLLPVEVMLRTRFAYSYGTLVGAGGEFAHGKGFTQSPNANAKPVHEYALENLDRSQETFISHYRDEIKTGNRYSPEAYARMPIWVAVEGMTFGSLSKLLTASEKSGVLHAVADSMNCSRSRLPGQIRSFVYLRNRCAHCSKIWNHSVLDVPGLTPSWSRRLSRKCGTFDEHSVYKIFAAIDEVTSKAGIATGWLEDKIEPLLKSNPLLEEGIKRPRRYQDFEITRFI